MITTTNLAKKLNVTRTAVLKHFKANRKIIGNHSFVKKNRRMFDDKATSILLKSFKQNNNKNVNQNKNQSLQNYQDLKDEIARQADDIKALHSQIKRQQYLELSTLKEIKHTQLKLINSKAHGWLWRLFH